MKLLRLGAPGRERPAVLDASGAHRDLSGVIEDVGGRALLPESLEMLRDADLLSLPVISPDERIGPCVAGTGKIMGIGLNYRAHAAETGRDAPSEPLLFMKATSAITGPFDDIVIPKGSQKTDHEAELGVVIGTPAVHVSEDHALDHVAGYCIVNDVSERAFQRERGGQMTKGKSCDTFAPLGPWLVTADEIADPQKLRLTLSVNGAVRQDASTADMIFTVAELISYLSGFFTLQTGDIIATGTPEGVAAAMDPPGFLGHGDEVTITIEGLGEQRSRFVAYEKAMGSRAA